MAIEKGSHVKLSTDETKHGRVYQVDGETVKWRTSRGAYMTNQASELTELPKDWKSTWAGLEPDVMELAANVAVFCGTQAIRKRKVFGEPTMRFAIQDAVYEFALKNWLRTNVESMISESMRTITEGDAAKNFSLDDVRDALAKSISIGLIDTIYKLAMKGKVFTMGPLYYVLQTAASFYIANIAQRQLRPEEGGFKP